MKTASDLSYKSLKRCRRTGRTGKPSVDVDKDSDAVNTNLETSENDSTFLPRAARPVDDLPPTHTPRAATTTPRYDQMDSVICGCFPQAHRPVTLSPGCVPSSLADASGPADYIRQWAGVVDYICTLVPRGSNGEHVYYIRRRYAGRLDRKGQSESPVT